MNRAFLSSLLMNLEDSADLDRRPITYHVWTNSGGTNLWHQANNWHNGQVPGTGSNVLLADYQHNCAITGSVTPIKSFNVRPTFNSHFSLYNQHNLLVRDNISINGGALIYIGSASLTSQSGDLNIDGNHVVYWASAKIQVSGGNAHIKNSSIYIRTGSLEMYGNGVWLDSNVTLPSVKIYGDVSVTGYSDAVCSVDCIVNGQLHILSGNTFTVTSNQGSISMTGVVDGNGSFVIEKGARFIRQSGKLDCNNFIVQDYDHGLPLAPATYTAKNIIFQDSDGSDDVVIFGTGNYVFNGNVEFRSWNSGTLEIQNDLYSPNLQFNKNVTLTGTNLSHVIWTRGDGTITLGSPSGIKREFTRYQDGRQHVNSSDQAAGVDVSRKNLFANLPILYINDNKNGIAPITIKMVKPDFNTLGNYVLSGVTGIGFADIAVAPKIGVVGSFIYSADMLDTGCLRLGTGYVYRAAEPTITSSSGGQILSTGVFETITVLFTGVPFGETGGVGRDVRAFMVDSGSNMYCITYKTSTPQLFKIEGKSAYPTPTGWSYVGDLNVPTGIVAANFNVDCTAALVKTYDRVYYYSRTGVQTIDEMLTGTTPTEILDYVPGYREESIAFGSGDNNFYVIGQFQQGVDNNRLRVPAFNYKKEERINFLGYPTESITMNSPRHTKTFMMNSYPRSFAADYGIINFSGNRMTTETNFYVGPSASFNYYGLPNSILRVGGDYLIVGTKSNHINLINFSGNAPAFTFVSGNANVFYADIENNSAVSGNTIYASFSNNHLLNVNWTFAAVDTSSGSTNLYMFQKDYIEKTGTLNMYMFGIQGGASGYFTTLLSGSSYAQVSERMFMFITGDGNISSSLPLYMAQSGVQGNFYLVTKGTGVQYSEQMFLYVGQTGIPASLPLYIVGHLPDSGSMNMYVLGSDVLATGLDLYMNSVGLITNYIKLYTHGRG